MSRRAIDTLLGCTLVVVLAAGLFLISLGVIVSYVINDDVNDRHPYCEITQQ